MAENTQVSMPEAAQAGPTPPVPPSMALSLSVEGVGNNALCYHGIQRVFPNTVVGFLREHLPHIFPVDHLQRVSPLA